MAGSVTGPEIERLIQLLARLPGLGPRSARRAALTLIKKRDQLMVPLAEAVQGRLRARHGLLDLRQCRHRRSLHASAATSGATARSWSSSRMSADLWALERAGVVKARYHVLGGTLSPLDGVGPEDLTIERLVARVAEGGISEVVIALNATVDGQTTAHYVTDLLAGTGVKVTRLAHGVPVGGELDYLDEGTLAAAMRSRTPF